MQDVEPSPELELKLKLLQEAQRMDLLVINWLEASVEPEDASAGARGCQRCATYIASLNASVCCGIANGPGNSWYIGIRISPSTGDMEQGRGDTLMYLRLLRARKAWLGWFILAFLRFFLDFDLTEDFDRNEDPSHERPLEGGWVCALDFKRELGISGFLRCSVVNSFALWSRVTFRYIRAHSMHNLCCGQIQNTRDLPRGDLSQTSVCDGSYKVYILWF